MKKRYLIAFIIMGIVLGLSYRFWLYFKTPTSARFDFYLFAIISILAYLGGLKLTEYLADFKYIKRQSRIEIVFLLVFFIMLFLPMSHINQEASSYKENRTLAVYKPLFEYDYKINYDFGSSFDNWFNDRFNLRYPLFVFNNRIKILFNSLVETKDAFYNRKTDYIANKDHLFHNDTFFSEDFPRQVAIQLNELNKFCLNHNIKLYVLIVPFSENIYRDKVGIFTSDKDRVHDVINSIIEKSDAKIIYPANELYAAKKNDYTFFKTEHHWTEYGAYIGYQKLMSEITKDFPQVPVQKESNYNILYSNKVRGDFWRDFGAGETLHYHFPYLEKKADKILDTKYKYYEHKNKKLLKSEFINVPQKFQKNFYYPYGADLRVFETGTSMNENLLQFMPYSFKHIKYIRLCNVIDVPWYEEFKIMKRYKQDIIDFKPDIMVLSLVTLNLMNINQFFEEDK